MFEFLLLLKYWYDEELIHDEIFFKVNFKHK